GHDVINLERNQFGGKRRVPLELPLGVSRFDHEVVALHVAEVTHSLVKGLSQAGSTGAIRQPAYSRGVGHLLGFDDGRANGPTHDKSDDEGMPHLHRGSGPSNLSRAPGRIGGRLPLVPSSKPNAGISRGRRPSAACRSWEAGGEHATCSPHPDHWMT